MKIFAGSYIHEVHKQFSDVASKAPSFKKFIVHAGRNFSMTANLGIFGVFEKIVNPGDAIVLELHEIPYAGHFVQVSINILMLEQSK